MSTDDSMAPTEEESHHPHHEQQQQQGGFASTSPGQTHPKSVCIAEEEESPFPYTSLPADLLDPATAVDASCQGGIMMDDPSLGSSLPDLAETLKAAFSSSRGKVDKDGVIIGLSSGM